MARSCASASSVLWPCRCNSSIRFRWTATSSEFGMALSLTSRTQTRPALRPAAEPAGGGGTEQALPQSSFGRQRFDVEAPRTADIGPRGPVLRYSNHFSVRPSRGGPSGTLQIGEKIEPGLPTTRIGTTSTRTGCIDRDRYDLWLRPQGKQRPDGARMDGLAAWPAIPPMGGRRRRAGLSHDRRRGGRPRTASEVQTPDRGQQAETGSRDRTRRCGVCGARFRFCDDMHHRYTRRCS